MGETWADLLDQLPDIETGWYGTLKVDTGDLRVWLAGVGDYPAAWKRSVIVERYVDSVWERSGEFDGDRPGPQLWGTMREAYDATVAMTDADGVSASAVDEGEQGG